jgi:hypothetical protein
LALLVINSTEFGAFLSSDLVSTDLGEALQLGASKIPKGPS